MSPSQRLAPLQKLRSDKEEIARRDLAQVMQQRAHAESALRKAAADVDGASCAGALAAEWIVADAAQARALVSLARAKDELERAKAQEEQARATWDERARASQVVDRLVEARREEEQRQTNRQEIARLDEAAMLLRGLVRAA